MLKENGAWVVTTRLSNSHQQFKDGNVLWEEESVNNDKSSQAIKRADGLVSAITRVGEVPNVPAMEETLMNFHLRLGHLNFDTIEKLAKDPRSGIKLTNNLRKVCVACAEGKQTKNNQAKADTGTHSPIDRIGGVICADNKGPITPVDRLGNHYISVFVDHLSSYSRVFLGKTKSQTSDQFEHFMAFFERMNNCKIHLLRTDDGAEFRAMDLFCERMGIGRQKTEPYHPSSNGKAERLIRKILELSRTVLLASGLPMIFWGDAVLYACYLLNRIPTRSNHLNKSPMEVLLGHMPYLGDMVPFGARCTVQVSHNVPRAKKHDTNTWSPRGVEARILGKHEEVKGYRVWLVKKNKVVNTQHVKNIECLNVEQNKVVQGLLNASNRIGDPESIIPAGEQRLTGTSEGDIATSE